VSQPGVRYLTLLGPTTITTSAAFSDINVPQGFSEATIAVTLTTTSGTSPTFDVFVQKQIPQCAAADIAPGSPTGTAIFDDLLHFTQLTTNTTRLGQLGTGYSPANTANATVLTTADWAQSDAASGANALAAGTLRMGPIGGDWRVKVTVGGTSPVTVMSVVAILLPFGG
jgi:hypothetical protein